MISYRWQWRLAPSYLNICFLYKGTGVKRVSDIVEEVMHGCETIQSVQVETQAVADVGNNVVSEVLVSWKQEAVLLNEPSRPENALN